MDETWHAVGSGFGDLFASLNWCLRRAQSQRLRMSVWSGTGGRQNDRRRLEEMVDVLALPPSTQSNFSFTDSTESRCIGYACWGVSYVPTKVRWESSKALPHTLAHQLDGVSSAQDKNPPQSDIAEFTAWAWERDISLMKVGRHLSIANCVKTLATASAFVGVCSGMSLLATATGFPITVVQYGMGAAYWYGPSVPRILPRLKDFMSRYYDETPIHLENVQWESPGEYTIVLQQNGTATWRKGQEEVQGVVEKKGNALVITWSNQHVYLLSPEQGGALLQEFDPAGNKSIKHLVEKK